MLKIINNNTALIALIISMLGIASSHYLQRVSDDASKRNMYDSLQVSQIQGRIYHRKVMLNEFIDALAEINSEVLLKSYEPDEVENKKTVQLLGSAYYKLIALGFEEQAISFIGKVGSIRKSYVSNISMLKEKTRVSEQELGSIIHSHTLQLQEAIIEIIELVADHNMQDEKLIKQLQGARDV